MNCPECKSGEIGVDGDGGHFCKKCGLVFEDNKFAI
jgi:transcription initiation factor TFIIIB Brf1 subunit/transcription initiation factor TFIIB